MVNVVLMDHSLRYRHFHYQLRWSFPRIFAERLRCEVKRSYNLRHFLVLQDRGVLLHLLHEVGGLANVVDGAVVLFLFLPIVENDVAGKFSFEFQLSLNFLFIRVDIVI